MSKIISHIQKKVKSGDKEAQAAYMFLVMLPVQWQRCYVKTIYTMSNRCYVLFQYCKHSRHYPYRKTVFITGDATSV